MKGDQKENTTGGKPMVSSVTAGRRLMKDLILVGNKQRNGKKKKKNQTLKRILVLGCDL